MGGMAIRMEESQYEDDDVPGVHMSQSTGPAGDSWRAREGAHLLSAP